MEIIIKASLKVYNFFKNQFSLYGSYWELVHNLSALGLLVLQKAGVFQKAQFNTFSNFVCYVGSLSLLSSAPYVGSVDVCWYLPRNSVTYHDYICFYFLNVWLFESISCSLCLPQTDPGKTNLEILIFLPQSSKYHDYNV